MLPLHIRFNAVFLTNSSRALKASGTTTICAYSVHILGHESADDAVVPGIRVASKAGSYRPLSFELAMVIESPLAGGNRPYSAHGGVAGCPAASCYLLVVFRAAGGLRTAQKIEFWFHASARAAPKYSLQDVSSASTKGVT